MKSNKTIEPLLDKNNEIYVLFPTMIYGKCTKKQKAHSGQ
jgi:hypothetical protein